MRASMARFSAGVKPQFSILLSNPALSLSKAKSTLSGLTSIKVTSNPAAEVKRIIFRPSLPAPTIPILENSDFYLFFEKSPKGSMGSFIIFDISLLVY